MHTLDLRPLVAARAAGRSPTPRELAGCTTSRLFSQILLCINHMTVVDPADVAERVTRIGKVPCSAADVEFLLGLLVEAGLAEDDRPKEVSDAVH